MGEDLDQFIEDQKAKLAHDRADLERDPPYMEIRSKNDEPLSVSDKLILMAKENIPPNIQPKKEINQLSLTHEEDYGTSLPLGEEYERKKHKLKEELRQDYRQYLSEKNFRSTGEVDACTRGLSLPIAERLSAKERLRIERNKEYNQFLREKEDENEKLRLARHRYAQRKRIEKPVAVPEVKPEPYTQAQSYWREVEPPKKDAYTSMEVYEELLNRRRQEEDRYQKQEGGAEIWDRSFSRKTEEELSRQHDNKADVHGRRRRIIKDQDVDRRQVRLEWDFEPNEEVYARRRHEIDAKERRHETNAKDRRPLRYNYLSERAPPVPRDRDENYGYDPEHASYFQVQRREHRPQNDIPEREPPVDYKDDFREWTKRPVSVTGKARYQIENSFPTKERSKSAAMKEDNSHISGLPIGVQDEVALQKRKETYRQELMEQMAEQQRNKRREKELELRVAASGASDPEKLPDRLKQLGAVKPWQQAPVQNIPSHPSVRGCIPSYEREKAPPEKPRVAFQPSLPDGAMHGSSFAAGTVPALNEEFHRGLSSTLGEIMAPRITALPPPPVPVLTENYRTPYDDAYYFYGARNPLDPSLAQYSPGSMGLPPPALASIPNQPVIQAQPVHPTGQKTTAAACLGIFPEDKPRLSKEAIMCYQEDLQQQIRERNERRRRDKEERERLDAKLEADMKQYNPWGKSGGGAPLRDGKGNLITDLNKMHKQNEDAYHNPDARAYEDKRAVVSVDLSLATPRIENLEASTNKISGFSFANSSPFARGNIFGEAPTEQQLQQQELYKEFLRLQIAEKRRREEEEHERIKREEEREEKRLAEQRAKLQREYEEEQEKKRRNEEEQRLKNEELMRSAEERRKEAERKRKEEEQKQEEDLRQYYERESKSTRVEQEIPRQPSPVIPTLQSKVSPRVQRPPSSASQLSVLAQDQAYSRAQSPPVPARRNQLRANEERKSVISELAELRKQLRSEQRRLEGRLLEVDREDESSPVTQSKKREKSAVDVFDMARLRMQAPVRRPLSKNADTVNIENIREFNELKYRDSETRQDVRLMFPDPPKDDQTLEIQQQALLREQQKRLNRMKRRVEMTDDFDEPSPTSRLRDVGMFTDRSNRVLKTSLLDSESAFIDTNGEPFTIATEVNKPHQPLSARERRRYKTEGLDLEENILPSAPPLQQPDNFSLHSVSSLNIEQLQTKNKERIRRLNELQNSVSTGEVSSLEDADDILKRATLRDIHRSPSVDTVATEPWLRPETSSTLKRFITGQSSQEQLSGENGSTFNWQGLSTAHG
ncbi:centrosome and spindle pole-associated protein 1 isoform X2 [Microcaecilia unicolor]|uniref:Centrosome and spindle pole-associated protein 1 isoform X2 n=1 Tax=Microcaecilia unicolor TaxID=1415580 RepID=A0A6P7YVD8_9AMPH|nr:centrosome and spindle pole-associated protein 1 isoform X2 [Microcaecilia unicolor]